MANEREIIGRFQEMRQQLAETSSKIGDLEAEAMEHELVIKTLKPMEKDRKCYRMVGDVLVQRSVAETLPAVERNKAGLDSIIVKLKEQVEKQSAAIQEYQDKYKIRIQGQDSGAAAAGGGAQIGGKPAGSAGAGVLV
ncbi:MAG: Prefoldin subunit-domain-containing protein [Monoraphidium minutum]|nr:MAG: Prefoldin subunit-domain-containing protein [Monoraphidium minutum]